MPPLVGVPAESSTREKKRQGGARNDGHLKSLDKSPKQAYAAATGRVKSPGQATRGTECLRADISRRHKMATPRVAPWAAVPIAKPDEIYAGLSDQAKEYPLFLESILRQEKNFEKPEALSRLRVLDCSTRMMIGHWCSSMLSELGAEVIEVEPPGGDALRQTTPFGKREYMFRDKDSGEEVGGQFLHEMRNKLSVTLNLEKEEGREILKKLVVHADVVIENAPPGQWDSWGIGYRQLRELNPRLIYCWVGQRGQWGPLKDKPGMLDPVAQAPCGFVHGTADPKEFGGQPTRSALWMADQRGGASATIRRPPAPFFP